MELKHSLLRILSVPLCFSVDASVFFFFDQLGDVKRSMEIVAGA